MNFFKKLGGFLFSFTRRRLIFLALIGFVTIGTTAAYAVWDQQTQTTDPIIDIGVGAVLMVSETLSPDPGKTLIPYGAFKGIDDVDEIVYTYTVRFNKVGKLTVHVASIVIGEDIDASASFEISLYGEEEPTEAATSYSIAMIPSEEEDFAIALITVRIRMIPPANWEEYQAIQSQTVTLHLEFKADNLNP